MPVPPDIIVLGYHSATEPGFVRASGGNTTHFLRADGVWTAPVASGSPLTDGNKGDITVASGGTAWSLNAGAVGTAELGGDITSAGKALLDDANAAAQRTTLGLGTAATSAASSFEAAGTTATHAALTSGAHGISTFGAALVDDANATAARTTLGLGTAATANTGDFDAAGAAAAVSASLATHTASATAHGITSFGASLVDDVDAAAARTTLGLAAVASSGSASDLGTGTRPPDRIADSSIDLAKIVDIPAQTLLGNDDVSPGAVQALTVDDIQRMLGLAVGVTYSKVTKTADTVFASATPADVPIGASGAAMSFSVSSGQLYAFRFQIIYRSDTATVGIGLSVTFPAVTSFAASVRIEGTNVDGTDSAWSGSITSSDDPVLGNAVAATNTDYFAVVEGTILPSAGGTLTLRGRTETGTTNVTVRRGTFGILQGLGAG